MEPSESSQQRFTIVELAVVIGILLVLLALLLPAVHEAREAARTTQSKNNLRQFGVAFYNYHSVHEQFPIGADVDVNGQAKHGWVIRTMPYLEANPLSNWVDYNFSWDHPINKWVFQRDIVSTRIPGVTMQYTTEGLGLLHYMANPAVFHRNSSVSIDRMSRGPARTWLLGEVSGHFQPWGYVFNWRELTLPFNDGDDTFGRPSQDGVQLCMGDGSVRFFSNDTNEQVVSSLAKSVSASYDDMSIPLKTFEVEMDRGEIVSTILDEDADSYSDLRRAVFLNGSGQAVFAEFRCTGKGGCPEEKSVHIQELLNEYPDLRVLIARSWTLTDADAALLSRFEKLQTAYVGQVTFERTGLQHLKSAKSLKAFICTATAAQQRAFEKANPQFQTWFR